ncbi:hypothetical protein [Luteolibacter luteus]|uniref:Class I SAM-dependent methyltransferase n=1 Tax=Luteolibacter luteus TaxID=2728835 RepID=A0A858RDV6_9BACT|nr:hypothetical protein [Luteolibacter luteus]QJE94589.1 hypothetical protein HHL09_01920 [Luteolibacter luteus]
MIKQFVRDFHYALNSREHSLFTHLLPEEKREKLGAYARKYDHFVETGTYLGETTAAMAALYKKVFTVEIHEELARKAAARFADHVNVEAYHGNSAEVLPKIIAKLDGPAVFWLDAHYSGPRTGKASRECPIEEELSIIFGNPSQEHLIFIDDARLFVGKNSYPKIGRLWKFVRTHSPYSMTVRDDIIRLYRDPERY